MTNAHETQCKIERQKTVRVCQTCAINEHGIGTIYEEKTQQTKTQLINVSE